MKKILYTCFLFLIVVFTIRNVIEIKAESYDYDSSDQPKVNDRNKTLDININSNFKPVYKLYRRTIIVFVNGFTKKIAGKHDIHYVIYVYKGELHDYYMFYYDNKSQPKSDYDEVGGYYFNGSASTTVTTDKGDLVKWLPVENPKSSTSSLSVGFDGKTPTISYTTDFNHRELDVKTNNNVFERRYGVEFSYNRSAWDYMWNLVPTFLWKTHITNGSCIYQVKKGQKPTFDIKFYGRMNYSHKYYDAWHTAERRLEV